MKRRILLAVCAALFAVPAVGLASAGGGAGPKVTIRIEGTKKTLLLPSSVRGRSGYITRFGAPSHKCPGQTAQGALDVATHGDWKGTWYSSYNEYFITSILGETPSGHDYWGIFVNGRATTKGACDLRLRAGEQLVFAVTNGKQSPAELRAPSTALRGRKFTVKLVGYTSAGRAKPLGGISITGNGIQATKTNGRGVATIIDKHSGVLVLRASPHGYIRTEALVSMAG